ncbi:MAG TPA: CPBP family intramembrane glutamic endopeptidase [Terriglobia bacterium]|nr:CPBP family intramembrane glutamic endopeptidase [Terriglobia bacterium]
MMTHVIDGESGIRHLLARMRRFRLGGRWYLALLIPPVTIIAVLTVLARYDSPVFAHGRYLLGATFGIAAAFFEEIGWTGFAFPKMRRAGHALGPAILLGLLWSCWHLPVISYLGTTAPHVHYWLLYFLAFGSTMTAMRVLISWVYSNTESLALAQLLHLSSTGSLVVLSPPRVSPAQEVFWYVVYGAALWVIVGFVTLAFGKGLAGRKTSGLSNSNP